MWKKLIIITIIMGIIALAGAGFYFYQYAVVPSKKNFIKDDTPGTDEIGSPEKTWFKEEANREYWNITSNDGLKLQAIYLPAKEKTTKNAILAHGYMGNAETMGKFAKMYYDWGYNVLVPDARGHGKSEGHYIGFGWPERKDYLQWIDKVIAANGADSQLALYGISMGGATVMMTSGEKLPKNVKAIVEDCGYTSAKDELTYQLKEMYNLPGFPLIEVTSGITKIRAGYFLGEASSVKQLKKNKTPIMFIHGTKDDFVPYSMLDQVYDATDAPKEKYVVEGAKHATAMSTDSETYKRRVSNFLEQYID
ncbi:alpha/beta hydrolase [Enterococcus sp. BWB1-3]|uniref:alpha/beta hydrolase n=1 Tax=Enterococcus sp. BWB1-3 TaxID=2787713 RepID=UPI0019215170|nr:alpha/beta hydrolase [Enterococcus sp. BWB1-3]MBL1228594.1 alpha/beta hydrolase [Enterococcus sp. BWB1-3]